MPCIWPELSLKDPVELKENMVLAIETFAGEPGEEGGIRLEDMGVVTKTGFELITNFPYDLAPTYY
jgi:Xaa-Pro aminopeptidase